MTHISLQRNKHLLPYKVYEHPKEKKNRSFLDFLSLKIPRISVGRQIFEVLFGHPLLSKGSDLLKLNMLGFVRFGKMEGGSDVEGCIRP